MILTASGQIVKSEQWEHSPLHSSGVWGRAPVDKRLGAF